MSGRRLAERLPPWMGSIRVRLTVLYSTVLFGLAALVVFGIYTGVSRSLDSQPVSQRLEYRGDFGLTESVEVIPWEEFERRVNQRALDKLREYSFTALGLLCRIDAAGERTLGRCGGAVLPTRRNREDQRNNHRKGYPPPNIIKCHLEKSIQWKGST